MKTFIDTGDDDFSFAIPGLSRFRVNAYKQRGTMSVVIRIITFELPDYRELMIPDSVMDIANASKGLVLVTGPAGSGKSTTLSCIVDAINNKYEKHIITLEDPLEYLHSHKKSIISQREINVDTEGYVPALRAALRQSPDVILLTGSDDGCGDGASYPLYAPYDRSCKHDRQDNRRIPGRAAASDSDTAFYGHKGCHIAAARPGRKRSNDPCI
jgi:energy-coupling factor transporter ATP-binding protein EcfA2